MCPRVAIRLTWWLKKKWDSEKGRDGGLFLKIGGGVI